MESMAIVIGAGISLFIMLVMFIFGLYTRRNFGWVVLCLAWGTIGYEAVILLSPKLLEWGVNNQAISILIIPVIQQFFVVAGVFFVVWREKFDNLIDGAVYGFATGLGYAAYENILSMPPYLDQGIESALLQSFSLSMVYATASGIIGIAISQFYFRHREKRIMLLLSGLGAGIGYTVLFNLLVANNIGGDFLPPVFGIGGITLVGLYVTGLLRKILIQVGIEKKRADSLLEIVIPIGIELSTEENFSRLLEKMLLEAKAFCKADAGTLYLMKEDQLEFAVVRNDTLDISIGGTSGNEVTFPPLSLYDKNGTPNHSNIATYAALTGKTVNIADSYEDQEFDFSGTREFDAHTGYQSISFLTIPLKNNEGKVLGVLQLLNALDSRKRILIPFDKNLQQLMESFSALACAALEGYIQEQRLRKEIQQLRIEIDAVKRKEQVEEITNSDYFKDLQRKAKGLRDIKEGKD